MKDELTTEGTEFTEKSGEKRRPDLSLSFCLSSALDLSSV